MESDSLSSFLQSPKRPVHSRLSSLDQVVVATSTTPSPSWDLGAIGTPQASFTAADFDISSGRGDSTEPLAQPDGLGPLGTLYTPTSSHCSTPVPDGPSPLHPSQWRIQSDLKRKYSEDLTSFAEDQGRRFWLKIGDLSDLIQFSHYSVAQQNIVLMANLQKQNEDLERVAVPEPQWTPPKSLMEQVVKYAYVVLVNPSLPFYTKGKDNKKDAIVEMVVEILRRHPGWGYNAAVEASMTKKKAVVTAVRLELTQVRAMFKRVIVEHTGGRDGKAQHQDIYTLCQRILTNNVKHAPKLTLSIQMAARFAFLRETLTSSKAGGSNDRDFWQQVDTDLEKIRVEKDNNAARISWVFRRYLECDRAKYLNVPEQTDIPVDSYGNSAEEHIKEHEINAGI